MSLTGWESHAEPTLRLRFSLAQLLMVFSAASILLWANVHPREKPNGGAKPDTEFDWPLTVHRELGTPSVHPAEWLPWDAPPQKRHTYPGAAMLNLAACATVLLLLVSAMHQFPIGGTRHRSAAARDEPSPSVCHGSAQSASNGRRVMAISKFSAKPHLAVVSHETGVRVESRVDSP